MTRIASAAVLFAAVVAQAAAPADRAPARDWFFDNVYGRRPAAAEKAKARFWPSWIRFLHVSRVHSEVGGAGSRGDSPVQPPGSDAARRR